MNSKLTTKFKIILSKVIPNSEKLRYLFSLPKLEAFNTAFGSKGTFLKTRTQLYDFINQSIDNAPISYLEFGVFKGKSMKYWSKINTHQDSLLHGFDTFSGLPESWDNFTGGLEKGFFDTKGQVPQIEDNRVSFYKGLFKDTFPPFLDHYKSENTLIINIDADLYSSTLFVLTMSHKILIKGSIIIFDEFSSILHEFRAFEDYCKSYNVNFEVLASTKAAKNYYAHVAVKIL
ncbi:TylF/MycF/NovP-related O-methyltransferase [Winogradskyella schleiferi]|uniref:TylF/MycF/NovP-related O-methyltransferase n=1 Tax=Winogradskyella schleiferi TaxID=2686078 RepID=UPI0015BAB45D|nr:TylF/MycF/NovP-related O-methyltransferase [Winogradskyella schleiferi]